MASTEWLDPGVEDARIFVAQFDSSKEPHHRAVVIEGHGIDQKAAHALGAVGFRKVDGDPPAWLRPGGQFKLGEIRSAFPEFRTVHLPFEETRKRFAGRSPLDLVKLAPVGGSAKVNRFQIKYEPASKLGKPIATIPTNLAAATGRALAQIEDRNGPVDSFVSRRCGWSIAELSKALSPEQIDAVAMALDSMDRGQGLVIADATGLGKGRVVAAVLRAIVHAGSVAIFITEKENLFSDLFRDIIDIGSFELFGRPFILNNEAEISEGGGEDRKVLHPAWDPSVVQKAIKAGELPGGTKLVMATYSQFNRAGSIKADFLRRVARGSRMVCDESHNAVGDSNTSENLGAAMDEADSVTFSSATFAKNPRNLAAYRRLFPASMRSSDLMSVLSSGGQAISEALSQMLAEDGAYLRREHDLSDIKIEVIEDTKRTERNRAYADALSPILSEIARLGRQATNMADDRNGGKDEDENARRRRKEFWYAANFGSGLAAIVRQFLTALKVELDIERCIAALNRGEKPVVVVESTMESLMRELASDTRADETADDVAFEGSDEELPVESRPPDFKDALRLFLDRTLTLRMKVPNKDPELVAIEDPDMIAAGEKVREMIAAFPDLSLSPIDDIRAAIEREGERLGTGWKAEEISARSVRVIGSEYVQLPKQDRVAQVAGFNSGRSDALVITRAASTGLSLHASEKVRDRRRRKMIELQIASNVVERMQFFGRVNRRGQVSTPTFETLSTGLPMETRNLALQNNKMAQMSANVTGSAENATSMDVPDIIDQVGNEVCKRLLEDRPGLAERMFIAMKLPDPEKAATELYHINKFLSRLILLPSQEQDRLYDEVVAAHVAMTQDLAARGRNPRGARELDGEWKVIAREIFEPGDPRDGEVFGRPVTVTTIERMREAKPLKADEILRMIEEAEEKTPKAANERFPDHKKAIEKLRPKLRFAALSKRYLNVEQALKDPKGNAVQNQDAKLNHLQGLIASWRPGCSIQIPGEEGLETGLVLEVRPPDDKDQVAHPGQWTIRYAIPGDERPRVISAAGVHSEAGILVQPWRGPPNPVALARFDKAPSGHVPERRKVLDGNLVRAVIAARNQKWGSSVLWTDTNGVGHRAMLIPKNKQDAIHALEGRTTSLKGALAVLRAGGELTTDADAPDDRAAIYVDRPHLVVSFTARPKTLKAFLTDEILAVTGPFAGSKDRAARVALPNTPAVVAAFLKAGHAFHFSGSYRQHVAKALMEEPEPAAAPAPSP
ncbi:Helicase C-terminal domain-containing protein [Hyphomicrobiales bacterium]|jgi:hypothetical protein|nr:Helicase C-terminal domain-containing protein [Hyphomicrobiales bacterium]CAH1702577.1 conserved hypothetical protein [Hyphomicrobiales bacterium]CAI0346780.1 Helicase C-terminal domain-containing protein [Hyphomicrobiales bacterium]